MLRERTQAEEYFKAVTVSFFLGIFAFMLLVVLFCFSFQKDETNEDFVQVRRRDLERLTTEVMQLRDFLPKVLDGDIVWTFQKLDAIESSEWCYVAS